MIAGSMINVPNWYLIQTNPRQEERADQNLRAWGVETFFPKFKERHFNQFTGEPTDIIKPLFARYIFARFVLDNLLHKARFTRGVHNVVSFGDGPTIVDQQIIALIRSRVGQDGFVNISQELNPGDEVVIKDGPLVGLAGILERETKDPDRVRVLLDSVSYQAHITIEKQILRKAG